MVLVLWLLSWKMNRLAKKRGIEYSFLFVHPDGGQLAEIGELLKAVKIRPVIDKTFPFDQAKEALAYLEKGRAKGKVVGAAKVPAFQAGRPCCARCPGFDSRWALLLMMRSGIG
jgi:hypothetical protein